MTMMDPMTNTYRPDVAWPADLAQEAQHYASGINNPGEVEGLVMSGRRFGITATEIRTGLMDAVELASHLRAEIFVDSGAFSEVAWSPTECRLVVVKPITDAAWSKVFALYERIAGWYGARAKLIAPDLVGDQAATLARLETYALRVAACVALGAQIIVPVQKGALPMSAMYARACEILGLRQAPIAGIPMKKDATSLADLAELVESLPWFGARLHLLGIGPNSPRFAEAIATVRRIRPNAEITSDSVTIRAMVGRTNGRNGGPRAITRYQDEARAAGVTDSAAVKAYALQCQGADARDEELDRAHAAGWFDTELYDSVEEAMAHRAAGYP